MSNCTSRRKFKGYGEAYIASSKCDNPYEILISNTSKQGWASVATGVISTGGKYPGVDIQVVAANDGGIYTFPQILNIAETEDNGYFIIDIYSDVAQTYTFILGDSAAQTLTKSIASVNHGVSLDRIVLKLSEFTDSGSFNYSLLQNITILGSAVGNIEIQRAQVFESYFDSTTEIYLPFACLSDQELTSDSDTLDDYCDYKKIESYTVNETFTFTATAKGIPTPLLKALQGGTLTAGGYNNVTETVTLDGSAQYTLNSADIIPNLLYIMTADGYSLVRNPDNYNGELPEGTFTYNTTTGLIQLASSQANKNIKIRYMKKIPSGNVYTYYGNSNDLILRLEVVERAFNGSDRRWIFHKAKARITDFTSGAEDGTEIATNTVEFSILYDDVYGYYQIIDAEDTII